MENNFLSLIKTRRSVRAYKPQPVPSEALDAVLEAGTYAPTGGGRQSPTIIAITDPKYRQEIARLNAEVMGNNTDPYYGAPVVILVLADGSANTFVEDGSCVLENMMLAAHALGLGTVWVHREREIFDMHWVIQLRKPVSPQHANKTILFGFNNLLSGAIFCAGQFVDEEVEYADE